MPEPLVFVTSCDWNGIVSMQLHSAYFEFKFYNIFKSRTIFIFINIILEK
jgi:hypothetical protein